MLIFAIAFKQADDVYLPHKHLAQLRGRGATTPILSWRRMDRWEVA